MRAFILLTKALADETRLRILLALRHGELCVCQVIELLRLAPSTISRHVTILYQAGLIERRKCGKWIYLQLVRTDASRAAKTALRWVVAEIGESDIGRGDEKRLNAIKAISLDTLCSPHRGTGSKVEPVKGRRKSRS